MSALVLTASVDRLVGDPRQRGSDWGYDVGNYFDPAAARERRTVLEANDGVDAFSGWQADVVRLGGGDVPLLLLDGPPDLGPARAAGPPARCPGQIALAEGTRRALDVDVGN